MLGIAPTLNQPLEYENLTFQISTGYPDTHWRYDKWRAKYKRFHTREMKKL
jgi:hypothetical protein